MDCPNCRLTNPPKALKCDCGYDFETGRIERQARPVAHSRLPERLKRAWWPDLFDDDSAGKANRQGLYAALFCCGVTVIFSVLGHFGYLKGSGSDVDFSALGDAGLFALIAVGIWRRSRVAAVFGLLLYLFETVFRWIALGPKNPLPAFIITLCFVNSVRATFWLHKNRIESR